jgi:hypothetical protein
MLRTQFLALQEANETDSTSVSTVSSVVYRVATVSSATPPAGEAS